MEKDGSGGGNDNDSGKQPSGNADNIMDAASLFGAYWGRDGGAAAAAAAQQQAALFANFGGGGGRYPQQSTLNVAANQAAQLGMHPAASAAWWQMASQLAAQDYLARLQASGLGFPPMSDPYAALSALGGMGQLSKQPSSKSSSGSKAKAPSTQTDRSGRSSSNSTASSSSVKEKSPANQGGHGSLRSYNYPKTSDSYGAPGNPSSASSSLASLSSLVSAHSSKHSRPQSKQSQPSKSPTVSSSLKERDLAALRSDLMMGYHAQNKQMSPLFANPFAAMGGSDKDRHSNLEQLASLQHSIMSDPASVLGGVRLPPDTEIIKYTSAISGPKQPPGSTNRGRKKTISLDPPHVSVLPSAPPPLKRAKMDQSESSRERHRNETARPPPFSLSDYAGLSRELLQSIASQSGISLSALEKQLAGTTTSSTSTNEAECLNLTRSSSTGSARTTEKRKSESPMDLGSGKKTPQIPTPLLDEDGPLNLSLKPSSSSDLRVSDMSRGSDALSKLSSLSSSLSVTTPSQDRVSRRKPGAKPRRVLPESMSPPRPRSSGSEDSEAARTEGSGRPRNLGRGVSKPKKNTVASLLAQSRALGLKPAIAQQLLTETDPEKIRQLLGEACASTDSECPSDSMSDSDTSDRHQDTHLRLPLALGWRRETLIKGLSRTGCVKGEVAYTAPDGHTVIRSEEQLNQYLEKNPNPPLGKDNFSFSSRIILGSYLQPGVEPNDYVTISEGELLKRVEEFRGSVPPVEKRMELAKQQQRHRDQARIARELERNDKAEMAKREKELRSQQILERLNKTRTQLTIQPVTVKSDEQWKTPEIVMGPSTISSKAKPIAPISLTLIPIPGPREPVRTIDVDRKGWKSEIGEYNALDKMMSFAEKVAQELPKKTSKMIYNFDLTAVSSEGSQNKKLIGTDSLAQQKESKLELNKKLLDSYSRIAEYIKGNNWSEKDKTIDDLRQLERNYLNSKNEHFKRVLKLSVNENQKPVIASDCAKEKSVEYIDLSNKKQEGRSLTEIICKKVAAGIRTYNIGKDGALSISIQTPNEISERRMKQEEAEKIKLEEQARRQQEREQKRQQAVLIKEQKYMAEVNKQRELIYTVELERERRRQHSLLIRQLETRKRWEEKERKKHQSLLDRLLSKEKKLEIRKREMEILAELRRPQEDSTLDEVKPLPVLERIPGLKLPGQAMSDILMVYEFIHNFGQTLGFDMESLPSLDVLQTALLPDSPPEPEGELVSLLTHLLVCAIEDPGIPHPGRHTTLLGHALRTSDITPDTISETLRIYLYANATGEVKSQFGLHQERERDKRIADHHQTDEEMAQTYSQPKNATYFKHLRDNTTYQLSEKLNTKPFLALNATDKSKILAFVCNELLQNKGVLRQIDASLDHLNALKKERYLLDAKIRKVRSLRGRTARAEAADRSLALNAIEKISTHHIQEQDATSNQTHPETPIDHTMDSTDERERDADSEREKDGDMEKDGESEREKEGDRIESEREQDSECRDDEMETPMSDDESEGMQHDEEEDSRMSSEELTKKLERLLKTSEQLLIQLSHAQHSLRATCFGQDRYWRRYWWLGKAGGILVEAMESAQPELMNYMLALEGCPLKVDPESNPELFAEKSELVDPSLKTDAQIKSELELKNIKSELNLSDHTQIIKYEPNVQNCKTEAIQMEEKYIQQHQNQHQEDMLDIEDSIPTAFLVQKPTHNNKPYEQNADEQKTDETPPKETPKPEEKVNELINNLDELKKMAESVTENLEKSIEDVKDEKENVNLDSISRRLHQKTVDGKWFSIIRHEKPLTYDSEVVYEDNSKSCAEIVMCQGPKWDVVNNLFQLRKPSLFTTSMVLNSLPSSNYYPDSCLTLSGLDQELVDCKNIVTKEEDEDQPEPAQEQPKPNATCTKNVVHASLSSYLQCESPPPLQLAEEERDQLGRCLQRGGPPKAKRVEAVQRDLRYGWWRIRDGLKLRELINSLATRGVRERELHNTILHHLNVIDLQFATGENTSVIFSKSDLDDIIERNEGYPLADVKHSINIDAMERIHAHLLETVKLLEERVCAASVQEKSWKPSKETHQPDSESLSKAKNALIALESAIERRYLKPPLGTRSDASDTTAVLQAESQANTNTQSPQFQDKHNNDNSSGNDAKCGTAPRGLYHWREGVGRARSAAQLHALRSALDSAIAWDKSIMKANCQFCSSGEHEDKLLLCDGCDKGYHTYCFKPKMDKIPEGDWYCFECVNKARGVKACIVCGGNSGGAKKLFACSLCPRAYHPDCHYPPLLKNPRGKWYCANCISKAPPKKPRASAKKRDSKGRELLNASSDFESSVPSPAASAASSSTLAEDQPHENGLHHANSPEPEQPPPPIVEDEEPPEKKRPSAPPTPANGTLQNSHLTNKCESPPEEQATSPAKENKNSSSAKKEKVSAKKLQKDLQFCRNILEQMERHRDAWPFLLPVNTKQFPSYKKIIRIPMDLSTIKKKLNDLSYKCKEEFAADVRQIFTNCEVFNEDDSPVGQAGHGMRQFFEQHFGAQN